MIKIKIDTKPNLEFKRHSVSQIKGNPANVLFESSYIVFDIIYKSLKESNTSMMVDGKKTTVDKEFLNILKNTIKDIEKNY